MLRVAAAIPTGSDRARSQGAWVAAVRAHPDTAVLRTDGCRNLLAVAWTLARHADWHTLTTRPTWAVLAGHTGLSRSTVAAWVAWLRARGLLGVVESGSTPDLRPAAAGDGRGNVAAEYVLTHPGCGTNADTDTGAGRGVPGSIFGTQTPEDETRTPTHSREGVSPARTRASDPANGDVTDKAALRTEQRIAAQAIQREVHCLRALSIAHVTWIARPYLIAGWTPHDLIHALNRTPDGQPWSHTAAVRHPAGWARHRLTAWTGADGHLLPSRGQQLTAAAEQHRATQAAARATRDRAAAERTPSEDAPPAYTATRAVLHRRLRSVDRRGDASRPGLPRRFRRGEPNSPARDESRGRE